MGPGCDEKGHRDFIPRDPAIMDDDDLALGDPVIIADAEIKTSRSFRTDGHPEIHVRGVGRGGNGKGQK
jgi:hypothetical protein